MNTKKNKSKQKQNKPPTPQPKLDVPEQNVEKFEEKIEVQEQSELIKSEERVPEIVSEVVQPILEAKVSESDTPKKPKRNRGKKKKGDKNDDSDDVQGQKDDEPILGECKDSEETETKDTCTIEEKPLSSEVTPIARRKKNKNKKHSEQTEKTDEQEVKVTPIKKGEELTDLKIVTVVPVTDTSEESKSKKKNKKKKRTDSERSDKAEEIISCTAAFQKLLANKDDKKDIKEDSKSTEDTSIKQEENKPIKDVIPSTVGEDTLKPEIVTRDKSADNKHETREDSGKGKKKNKKGKNQPPKEETAEESLRPIETKAEITSEEHRTMAEVAAIDTTSMLENISESMKTAETEVEKPSTPTPMIEKEKSPKPKAKIAKPVDKKRKEKLDVGNAETLSKEVSKNILAEDKPKEFTLEVTTETKPLSEVVTKESPKEQKEQILPKDEDIPAETETKVTEIATEVKEQSTDTPSKTDLIAPPQSSMGKKRKKSPKPKGNKNIDIAELPTAEIESKTIEFEIKESSSISQDLAKNKEDKPVLEIKPEEIKPTVPVSEEAISKETEPVSLSLEFLPPPQQPSEVNILETPEVKKEEEKIREIVDVTAIKEDLSFDKAPEKAHIQVSEPGSGKKRKKSPKPQKKAERSPGPSEKDKSDTSKHTKETIESFDSILTTTSSAELLTTPPQEPLQTDSPPDLPSLEDIEIRSVKANESEGSACSITPDIQYPRASSQHLDTNNNTVIQDITASESDVKHNIPTFITDTPVIQGSGETPLPQVEATRSGVTITEMSSLEDIATASKFTDTDIQANKPEEKTDLKSKVLDVNQGMEELRRSIERSLAELSSMEKSEKEAEDEFLKAQAKLEKITEMASKKSEDNKQHSSETIKKTQEKVADTQIKDKDRKQIEKAPETSLKSEEIKFEPVSQLPQQTPSDVRKEKTTEQKPHEKVALTEIQTSQVPPVPARKDNKGKNKKKKGKQDFDNASSAIGNTGQTSGSSSTGQTSAVAGETKGVSQDTKTDTKSEQKSDSKTDEKGKQQSGTQEKGKQQSAKDDVVSDVPIDSTFTDSVKNDFEPIENFEDALYSSLDENDQDVNKNFEIIANEATKIDTSQNPEINVTAPTVDDDNTSNNKEDEKVNPVSQPKNLLGHPDIPARLNRTDYKKEKNKFQTPNTKQATVKIKDADSIEISKESKESQTENKKRFIKDKTVTETITSMTSENEDYIYKYSFRKVFLPNACHVCKKDLKASRTPCNFCNLIFYCSVKHKDEDYPQHQGLCFAVSTIVHLKDQKHIYGDAKNVTGHEYRLLRMQMIVSCEKVLKRRLVPWEQEALLYPRICADVGCREWRQNKLVDCEGCGQISYCLDDLAHLPKSHQRWCKSYSLYNKLVVYQQTKGRLEPRLPTRVMPETYQIPEKLNEVLASMYEEKIDMTDIQYAALTQIATAPLTAAYCHQLYNNKLNSIYANGVVKKSSFTIHVVGAELQFEADALNKWEVFFLHLRPDVKDLRVVLIGPDLNPSKLPLDLLSKIKLCENCRQNNRRVMFDFQDKKTYYEYWSTEFTTPDLVCAFNPSIQRSSVFNGKDIWPSTIKCITKLKVPFLITSYTMSELQRDLARIKECADVEISTVSEPEYNAFASVRPDRNFISDDEMPLLFKNFCFSTVCGEF